MLIVTGNSTRGQISAMGLALLLISAFAVPSVFGQATAAVSGTVMAR
jgi:hypothetical protein